MTKAEKNEMLTIGRHWGLGISWTPKRHTLAKAVPDMGNAGDVVLAGFPPGGGVLAWCPRRRWLVSLHITDLVRTDLAR